MPASSRRPCATPRCHCPWSSRPRPAVVRPGSFVEQKAANAVRGKLQALLGDAALLRPRSPRPHGTERAGRRGAARRHHAAARPGRSAVGARRRAVRLPAAEGGRRHQQDHVQLHAVRARRAQQPAARADRHLRPALRHQRGRSPGPRLDRQAAHARHLPRTGGRLAPALERPVGRAARRAEDRQARPAQPVGARSSRAGGRQEPHGDARSGDGAHAIPRAPPRASSPAAACITSRTSSPRTTAAR